MYYIEYKGKKFPARDIDNVPSFEDEGTVTVAEHSLWDAIKEDYSNEDPDAIGIDDQIFTYVDYGSLTTNPSDNELRAYLSSFLNGKNMRKEFLIVRMFVMFGYNFPNIGEVIDYICMKCGKTHIKSHIRARFDTIYDIYGCHAVMNRFMVELDEDLQEALVDYAINVYSPKGMSSKYNEYKTL